MSAGRDEHDQLSWLVALHEAVVADRDGDFSPADSEASPRGDLDAFRNCLRQLEEARRAGGRQFVAEPRSQTEADTTQRIGKFEIQKTLGDGGQGIVYLAFDTDLRRHVALKIPKLQAVTSPDQRRRFLREAHAAAALNHPSIVAVYEIGDVFPSCYLVSEYCPGGTLQQYLHNDARQIKPREAAQFVAELADAVHFAHANGVLHRDIKPSNVFLVRRQPLAAHSAEPTSLLDFKPRLGDFGLARLMSSDAEKTATGVVIGTPGYMAPEQAGGQSDEIGPATDVYGLGALLYELLVGRPVFRGVSEADTLRQVLFIEPEPPRRSQPRISRDLEAVCLRALEKNPHRRYSSAAAMADDLQRYLQGVPTLVRPLGPLGKLWRLACRRPAVATLAALLSLAVLVALALFVTSDIQQRRLNSQLIEQRNAAEQYAREALNLSYAANMQLADQAWRKNDISAVESILARYVPGAGQYDPRGVEWYCLQTQLSESSRIVFDGNGPGGSVQFSRDGKRLATGGCDGKIRIWEMPAATIARTIAGTPGAQINALEFSPDGRTLAAASDANRVLLCDPASGELLRSLDGGHTEWVSDIDFSPDGEWLCSVAGDGMVVVWDWKSGQQLQRFRGHAYEIRSVRFTRDGQHVITGGEVVIKGQSGKVQIWNLKTQLPIGSIEIPQLGPTKRAIWPRDIALSPDRSQMAVCWDAAGLRVYDLSDLANPQEKWSLPDETGNQVIFLSQSDIAVGSSYGAGHIWTLGEKSPKRKLLGHGDKIVSVSFAEDGQQLATASKDGSVRVWSVGGIALGKELGRIDGMCVTLAIAPSSKEMGLELRDPDRVAILAVDTGKVCREFPGARTVAYSTHGRWLAVGAHSTIAFYDQKYGDDVSWDWSRPVRPPANDAINEIWGLREVFLVRDGTELLVLDPTERTVVWQCRIDTGLRHLVVSPDDQFIYLADQSGVIRELSVSDGSVKRQFQVADNPVEKLALSSDGRFLLSASANREIWLWDRAAGTKLRRFASSEQSLGLAKFTPDGRTVIARHNKASLGFWHVATGQRLLTLGPWGTNSVFWDLSPDGRSLCWAVNEGDQVSVRAMALDGQHATAGQTSPAPRD